MKYEELTGRIIACAMRVHSVLGNGFQEIIYQRAMAIELPYENLLFEREKTMYVHYRDQLVGKIRVDFFIEEKIMVELKAVIQMDDGDLAQALNYLEICNMEIGLLINFGSRSLTFKRLFNKKFKQACTDTLQSSLP